MTCYKGVADAATGASAPKDAVKVLVDPAVDSGRAWIVTAGAQLGFRDLLIDGQGKSRGVNISGFDSGSAGPVISVLETKDVTFQHFGPESIDNNGDGSAVTQGTFSEATLTRTSLCDNTCGLRDCYGGAMKV